MAQVHTSNAPYPSGPQFHSVAVQTYSKGRPTGPRKSYFGERQMNRTKSIRAVQTKFCTNVSVSSTASHQPGALRDRAAARFAVAAAMGMTALAGVSTALADDSLPPISIGAGMRTSFETIKSDDNNGNKSR